LTLSLREMDVFRRVMELGSITAAAAALNISQPAASRLLQQAEERLGFPLFRREKKRLRATAEADALFPEAVGAFAAIDSVQRLAGELRAGQRGTLTVAAIPALANALIPFAVQRFRPAHPGVLVRLLAHTAHDIANLVNNQRADLGVIIGPMTTMGVSVNDLCSSDLGCVMPRNHPLSERDTIRPADLQGEHLIGLSRHLPLGAQLERLFADANVSLRLGVEVTQSTVALSLVRTGVGVALLDGFSCLSAWGADLSARPLAPRTKSFARTLTARDRPLTRLATEFRNILHDIAGEMDFDLPRTKAH
jgi:DNA-binding transcriptional LysR family regulator